MGRLLDLRIEVAMGLRDLCDRYVLSRDVSRGYAKQLQWCLNALERWAGVGVLVSDLDVGLLNNWLREMKSRGLAAETRRSRKRMLLTLWDAAADEGLCDAPRRRRVMRIRDDGRLPQGYSIDDARQLLAAAKGLRGRYARIDMRRCDWWQLYVRLAWDTGLRGVDVRRIELASIAADGSFRIMQHKTGRPHSCCLHASTLRLIQSVEPLSRRVVCPLWARLDRFRREGRKLIAAAGLPGSLKWLRSGSGTDVEISHPGQGHRHLGNGAAIFEKHYFAGNGHAAALPEEL